MKIQLKNPIKKFALIFMTLTAMLALGFGCNTSKTTPDPLAGWKSVGNISYRVDEMHAYIDQGSYNKAIIDDVQQFVNNLPISHGPYGDRRYSYWLQHITLFEDGTGQHAVDMQMEFGGLGLRYVLFYDKSNVRTKVQKIEWHYQS